MLEKGSHKDIQKDVNDLAELLQRTTDPKKALDLARQLNRLLRGGSDEEQKRSQP